MRVDCSSMEELFPSVYQIPLISLLIQHAYFYDKVKKLLARLYEVQGELL